LAVFHCDKEGASLGSAAQNPNRKKDEWGEANYSVWASLHLFNVTGAASFLFHVLWGKKLSESKSGEVHHAGDHFLRI
jgi:hypothetical protein